MGKAEQGGGGRGGGGGTGVGGEGRGAGTRPMGCDSRLPLPIFVFIMTRKVVRPGAIQDYSSYNGRLLHSAKFMFYRTKIQ